MFHEVYTLYVINVTTRTYFSLEEQTTTDLAC